MDRRYNMAVQQAKGCGQRLGQFEAAAGASKAVIARSQAEVVRLATADNEVYATYYDLASAWIRLPNGDKWGPLRAVAEEALFPNYRDKIRFAALSLHDRGLPNFGDSFIVLREDMIAHRASVFEENCVTFMKRHKIRMDQAYSLPRGYRATWGERGRLCVAKKAHQLASDTRTEDFGSLLLKAAPKREDDDFVEVHVWGPMTRRTFEKVTIEPGAKPSKSDAARLRGLKEMLGSVGVALEVIT